MTFALFNKQKLTMVKMYRMKILTMIRRGDRSCTSKVFKTMCSKRPAPAAKKPS